MATDLEKLVVSLDADIRQLTNKLNRAGIQVEQFGKKADRDTAAIGRKIAENVSKGGSVSGVDVLSYSQKQEFAHIGKSIADEIAAGASPLRALQVEGGRIVEVFSSGSGGVAGTFKALGSTLVGLATPAVLAAASIGGIAAAAIYAYASFEEMEQGIKLGLTGIGGASGATVNDIRRIGTELATAQGISVSAGEDIALSLAKTGRIDVGSIGDVGRLTKGYAALTGTDLGTAGKALGTIFADPGKGAQTLQNLLGSLDAKTRDYIATLAAQGRQQDAIKALAAAATPDLLRAADATGVWAKAWERIATAASSAAQAVGAGVNVLVNGPGPDEKLSRLLQQLNNMERASQAGLDESPAVKASRDAAMADARRQIAALQKQIAVSDKASADDSARKALNSKVDEVSPTVTGANGQAAAIKSLEDAITALHAVLAIPGAADLIPGGADNAKATVAGLETRLAALKQAAAEGGQAVHDATREADFHAATAGLEGYALQVANARHEIELLRQQLVQTTDPAKLGAALATLPAIETKKIDAIQQDHLNKTSKYAHSVSDAPDAYQPLIFAASEKSNIDPDLLASLLYQESKFKPNAVSPKGARGLGQFMPGTAVEEGVDVNDPASSIYGAAAYLKKQIDTFGGDIAAGLTAYNAGGKTVKNYLAGTGSLTKEAQQYAPAIMKPEADFQKQTEFSKDLTDKQTAAEHALAEAKDNSTKKTDAARIAAELLNDAQNKGIPITAERQAQIEVQAQSLAKLADAENLARLQSSIDFQRRQFGLTPDEQQVDAQLRSAHVDPDSTAGAQMADQLRQVQLAGQVKSESQTFVDGITHALIEGRSAAEAFHNALIALSEKIADKTIDSLLSSLFSTGTGGSGIGKIFGFAQGGAISGPGSGTSDSIPAMLSHGEYVINAGDASRNRPLLDAINSGRMRRFAAGGPVGMAALPNAIGASSGGASSYVHAPTYNLPASAAGVTPEQMVQAIGAYDRKAQREMVTTFGRAQQRYRTR